MTLSDSFTLSSSVLTVNVAVVSFASNATSSADCARAAALMVSPVSSTVTATVRAEVVALVRVSVKTAFCPSLTDSLLRLMLTVAGMSSNTTLTLLLMSILTLQVLSVFGVVLQAPPQLATCLPASGVALTANSVFAT